MSPLQEPDWCHRHWSPLQGTVPRLLPIWDDYPKLTEKFSNVDFFSLQNLLESRYQLSTWISVSHVMKPEHCWQRTENQSLRSIDLHHNACGDIGAPLGEALRWSDVDVFFACKHHEEPCGGILVSSLCRHRKNCQLVRKNIMKHPYNGFYCFFWLYDAICPFPGEA